MPTLRCGAPETDNTRGEELEAVFAELDLVVLNQGGSKLHFLLESLSISN